MRMLLLLVCCVALVSAKELLQLQGDNFELALTTYKYLAVLFVDDSRVAVNVRREWIRAAELITDLPEDAEIALLSNTDPHNKELIEAYGIALPIARVFRRGVMAEYRGPYDAAGIAEFIMEDAKPSVQKLSTIKEMKALLDDNVNTILFGLFNEEDVIDETIEGYGIDAWGQYQAAADSLRGHASFYLVDSKDVLSSFKLKPSELPVVYMVSSEGEGFMKYTGEILEMNLAEWVLRNSAPGLGELSVTSPSGELYATQFFSSKKLKFILIVTPDMLATSDVLDQWKELSNTYKGKAIFSFMSEIVSDVVDYFDIKVERDLPLIAAHQPSNDFKFKSAQLDLNDRNAMEQFVTGVMNGSVQKIFKSEPLPKNTDRHRSPVLKAVGNNVLDIVSREDRDVLLMVYSPWCANCRKLVPTFDILGRAVEAEPRIVLAKIDLSLNDIPASWEIKTQPTLLWFPAKDKPYKVGAVPTPRPYWDALFSLQELVGFVQRQGSFDSKTLRVATIEQLGSLLSDEEELRKEYDLKERQFKRNEGRVRYENAWVDYLIGEVTFDGTRGHLVVMGLLAGFIVIEWLMVLGRYLVSSTSSTTVRKKKVT